MKEQNKEQAVITRKELDLIKECIACIMTLQMQIVLALSRRDEIDLTDEYGDLLTQVLVASTTLRDKVSPEMQAFKNKQKGTNTVDIEFLSAVMSGLKNIEKEQRKNI